MTKFHCPKYQNQLNLNGCVMVELFLGLLIPGSAAAGLTVCTTPVHTLHQQQQQQQRSTAQQWLRVNATGSIGEHGL